MSLNKSITHGKEHRKPYRGAKWTERRFVQMIELTALNVMHIIASLFMVFFWGMSIDRGEEMRKTAKRLWYLFLVIVWICIFLK